MLDKVKRALSAAFPKATTILIAINTILFLFSFYSGNFLGQITQYQFLSNEPRLVDMIVAMFLHGSWGHLIGNMILLYIMGIVLEHKIGSTWFVLAYFLTGFAGDMMFSFMQTYPLGSIGASGAIYGLCGIFTGMFPLYEKFLKHWLDWTVEIFLLVLVLWCFHSTLVAGLHEPFLPIPGGVANWAHVGGFLVGLLLGLFTKIIHSITREVPPNADND